MKIFSWKTWTAQDVNRMFYIYIYIYEYIRMLTFIEKNALKIKLVMLQ